MGARIYKNSIEPSKIIYLNISCDHNIWLNVKWIWYKTIIKFTFDCNFRKFGKIKQKIIPNAVHNVEEGRLDARAGEIITLV